MIYGYAKIIKGQSLNINSMERQVIELITICDEVIEEYTIKDNKPLFEGLLKKIRAGDTLVVTKISKMAKTIKEGNNLIKELINKGIKINILNLGLFDDTAATKEIKDILISFVEFEKDIFLEKTMEGKFIASKNDDFKCGRKPKFDNKEIEHALSLLTSNGGCRSYKQVSKDTGISLSTLYRFNY